MPLSELEGLERRVAQEVQLAVERRRVADEALQSFTGGVNATNAELERVVGGGLPTTANVEARP